MSYWPSGFQQENQIAQEVVDCARTLRERGHRCVLGTNQEKYRAAYLWDHMRLKEWFDGIFPSCELGAAKPSSEYFAAIQKFLGAPAACFLLIDDQGKNVTEAQAAGWDAIHFKGIEDVNAVLNAAI